MDEPRSPCSIVNELISGALRSPTARFTPQTEEVPLGVQLGDIASGIPWIAVVALAATVAVIALVQRTRLGLRLRATGLNVDAVWHAGVGVRELQVVTFAVSGALAGFAGALVRSSTTATTSRRAENPGRAT